ncbi:MAG: cell division protein ZapA [Candidatus Kryptonium sp.]|nr:cell division protein ZapA [Candidatus Kryptonium sp.]MCX7762743.1 cell division protein ZapA [Candidatus Kryptonium sp.]MDW8108631.1 cell division protein ZapA [Candidatus Kryptonium sp.]
MDLSQPKIVKVKIFNTEYTLKVEDEEIAYKVAEYVDKMMNELHNKLPEQSVLTIAILTALNIAEELFRERMNRGYVESEIENMLLSLSSRVDKILSL